MKFLLIIILSFWLVSCRTPLVLTPAPAPSSVFISYPSFLQPELNKFTDCAGQISIVSVFTLPDPTIQSSLPGTLLKLQLGSASLEESHTYQIGQLELKIIVNADNPIDSLSTDELLAIYTGEQKLWEHNNLSTIQVWSYPIRDDLRSMFEAALPGTPRLTLAANITPNPQAILQAIASDANAIGYLPASWLENISAAERSQIKSVSLDNQFQEHLIQPVIVSVNETLTYEIEALLVCVQQAGN